MKSLPGLAAAWSLLLAAHSACLAADTYEVQRVLPITITVTGPNTERLKTQPNQYVAAALQVDGQPLTDVTVRLRGHGTFRPVTEKPNLGFKLGGDGLSGRKRLLLNNSVQDPSFLRWKLASDLFLQAKLPAPRVNWARVQLNGRDLGLYLLIEPTDKDFLRRHFGSPDGNLYEGSNRDVNELLEQDSGKEAGQTDLQLLAAASAEPDPARRWTSLAAILDIDKFISFMVLEALIGHHDGYSYDRNNFRVYHDPASNKFVFIPHGLDLIFDNPNAPLDSAWRGLVARALMDIPKAKELYRERLGQLSQSTLADQELTNRLQRFAALIKNEVSSSEEARKTWATEVDKLGEVIRQRRAFVLKQIKH
jgi:hypothetical protein